MLPPLASCLLLSLVLHAYHARSHFYHHCFAGIMALSQSSHGIPVLLCKSLTYFALVTVLGDIQRVVRSEQTWVLCFPPLAALLALVSWARGVDLSLPVRLVGALGLHCLFLVLYWRP